MPSTARSRGTKTEWSKKSGCGLLECEDEDTTVIQNTISYTPNNTAKHPRSSATPL
jgi:hypothetical protein